MRLSKKGEYAIKALEALTLAHKSGLNHSLHLRDIATSEGIPIKFLEHIMVALKRGGLIRSQKGKGGGYVLSRSPKEITLGEVIRLIDGPLSPIANAEEIKEMIRKGDRDSGLYSFLLEVRNAISDILDTATFEDLYVKNMELCRTKPQCAMYSI